MVCFRIFLYDLQHEFKWAVIKDSPFLRISAVFVYSYQKRMDLFQIFRCFGLCNHILSIWKFHALGISFFICYKDRYFYFFPILICDCHFFVCKIITNKIFRGKFRTISRF